MQHFLSLFLSLTLNSGPRKKKTYLESQSNLSSYPQWDAAHTALLVPKSRLLLTCKKWQCDRGTFWKLALPPALPLFPSEQNWLRVLI